MAARSDQLATSPAAGGVAQRDRVMVMLGNHVELWESMLAVMKLGAVIMPATTASEPDDLADRIGRGRCVMPPPMPTRSTNLLTPQGDFDRIAVGRAPRPWRPYWLADAVAPPSRLA